MAMDSKYEIRGDSLDKKILYSLLITIGIVLVCLFVVNMILNAVLGELGIYVSMFATIIFTIVYCTQLILGKLDNKEN